MKKVILVSVVVVMVFVVGFVFLRFGSSEENGKAYAARIAEESKKGEYECAWSGFVYHRKKEITQVFVACDVVPLLKSEEISSQEELTEKIHDKVIKPLIPVFPENEDLYITVIGQVQQDTVICVDVKQKKITGSGYDSYENYCWPA